MHVGEGGEPGGHLRLVEGPARHRLSLGLVGAVVGVGDAAPGAERVEQPGNHRQLGDQAPDRAGHPIHRLGVEQDGRMLRGQLEQPFVAVGDGLDHRGGGLLLQPLTHHPFVGARALGEVAGGGGPVGRERLVEAEPDPEVDRGHIERPSGGGEEAVEELRTRLSGTAVVEPDAGA